MKLKIYCAHCSEYKEVELKSNSALSRRDAAYRCGWSAVISPKTSIIEYFCSPYCERTYLTKRDRHLTLVKN